MSRKTRHYVVPVAFLFGLFQVGFAFGDVVTWIPDADGQWEEASNWSSDPNLPGPSDDVTIDVAGGTARTVTIADENQSVQSLTCAEDLDILGGNLTVGSGVSVVNGSLTMGAGKSLTANGGQLTLNGSATIDNSNLYVKAGGVLRLTQESTYDPVANGGRTLSAQGEGSLLDLHNLTSISGTGKANIQALDGGKVDLGNVTESVGARLSVKCSGAGPGGAKAVIDLTRLGTVSADSTFVVADGGDIQLSENLTEFNDVTLEVHGSGEINTTQFKNVDMSHLKVYDGSTLTLPDVPNYDPVVAGTTGRILLAKGDGSLLMFSGLTSISGSGRANIQALDGGEVDLGNVTKSVGARLSVKCSGTGAGGAEAVVNLTSLTTVSEGSTFAVMDGGDIQLSADLTQFNDATLEIHGTGTIHVGELVNSVQFTDVNRSNLEVYAGASLTVPGVSSLDPMGTSTSGRVLLADGEGSISVLSLPSLTSIAGNGNVSVRARDGGTVDLSRLETAECSGFLRAEAGGTIRLNPTTTRLVGIDAFVGLGGTLEVGTLELAEESRLYGTMALDSSVVNGGIVSPGDTDDDAQILEISGDYTQTTDGAIEIDLAGLDNSNPDAIQFDRLLAGGDIVLAGTLDLDLLETCAGDYGESVSIMEAGGSLTGIFDRIDCTSSVAKKTLAVDYASDRVTVTIVLPGDLNGDGFVGSKDLDLVRGNWGGSARAGDFAAGDPSGDGTVGSADLDIVRGNWGSRIPSPASVPEPSVFAILIAGLIAFVARRSR